MSRAAASLALALCLGAGALLAGCAAPGDPSTRHPVVPAPITNLSASQRGDEVVLSFTLPTQSADRDPLGEAPSVEIYRAPLPSGATPDRKINWRLVYEIPSARVDSYLRGDRVEFHDPLTPDDLARLPGSSLAYTVRTRAVKVRSSADSNYFTLPIFPFAPPPRDPHASVTETAVVVAWVEPPPSGASSSASPSGYRVYRGEVESEQEAAAQNAAQIHLKSPMILLGPSSAHEFRDSHFEFGKTYVYTVRSVAQFGGDLVESADSSPVVVTPRDTFPPAAPGGLEAALIPATPQSPAYVDLSWAISPEEDLAGYHVYRSDGEDAAGERADAELLPSPTFRDISIAPGKRYFYRVSAVDRAGNESPRGSQVQVEVP